MVVHFHEGSGLSLISIPALKANPWGLKGSTECDMVIDLAQGLRSNKSISDIFSRTLIRRDCT